MIGGMELDLALECMGMKTLIEATIVNEGGQCPVSVLVCEYMAMGY